MLRVGLTGGIASGKSAVATRLAELGAVVIDADALAREVVDIGTPGLAEVARSFGAGILAADGSLDRARLAEIVFDDHDARRRLESIIHPRVRVRAAELEQEAGSRDPDAVVIHMIPLLVETGQAGAYDVVVVVDVDPEVQMRRLVQLRGMTPDAAEKRIGAQASRAARLEAADGVIDNDGSLEALDEGVRALWQRLRARAEPGTARGDDLGER